MPMAQWYYGRHGGKQSLPVTVFKSLVPQYEAHMWQHYGSIHL